MKLTKVFFDDVRSLIVSARATVARGVDLVQVHTNFEIGRRIIEQEQKGKNRAAYGQQVLQALSEKLASEFGDGFSARNLASMRTFYLAYRGRSPILQSATAKSAIANSSLRRRAAPHDGPLTSDRILQSLTAKSGPLFKLSWTHYVFLIGIKDESERSFYEIEAADQDWTVRELKRQYDSSLYERLALSRNKAGIRKLAKKGQQVLKPQDILKDPLVLEFLGLPGHKEFSESELEKAVIDRLEHFLLELGKGFLFQTRQHRFTFGSEHFFVDLVFYNRLLRCYVLIDLKLGRITRQDLGQMQMYVNYFDRFVKSAEEKPTVGIILCKQKNDALVEITLPKAANIHAREYRLYLPSKEELRTKLREWT